MDPDQPHACLTSSNHGWVLDSRRRRVIDIAYGIILGFIAGVLAGLGLVIADQAGLITPGWQNRIEGLDLPGFGFGLLGAFLYHSITEGMFGASLGKLACRLRVVTEEGRPIGFGRALMRSLAYYFDALFFGLVAYSSMKNSPLNQRYGDKWAHTVVVPSNEVAPDAKGSVVIFILAFLIGSACWIFFAGLGVAIHAL